MDKNAIKRYAVWARRELIDRVSKRAAIFGVTTDGFGDPNADSVNGHLLSDAERRQRQALIRRIEEKGYEQVMEEVAYTWFNRFAALRFMEVNGYLPSHIRVFTNDAGEFKPQILSEAIHLDLIGLNMEKVYQLKDANQEEELFKYLLIVQCNALNGILPGMFQKIDDYTELLLPDYLLREGSAVEQMVSLIPEDDWKDQVQIIGWLYQYYNTEPKDKVFADLKKNIKISKQNIPAATQLFTPDWIVHYMVENSLGRLWVEGHPSARKYLPDHNEDGSVYVEEGKWNYYLEEAEQEPEVQAQLDEIRKQYAALKPEEILTIDPCAGSGHILCVLFDVLVNIYEDYGYTAREAAVSIVQHNLWGLDIDDRAAQLAYFAVMMKARQYDRRFFTREVQPHVYAIQESNGIDRNHLNYLGRGLSELEWNNAVNQMNSLLDEFVDAKEYGSILQPKEYDWGLLTRFVEDTTEGQQMSFEEAGLDVTQEQLREVIVQGQMLAQKYQVTVTNPPYLPLSSASEKLYNYMKKVHPTGRNDLYAVFIERCHSFLAPNGYQAMITQHSWMFLSRSFELRNGIMQNDIVNLVHLGTRAFEEIGGEVVQTVAFILHTTYIEGYSGKFIRLVDYNSQNQKETAYLGSQDQFVCGNDVFYRVPGHMIVYWTSEAFLSNFDNDLVGDVINARVGLDTGNNDKYLRLWFEVDQRKVLFNAEHADAIIPPFKWVPHTKGGPYRKWYGNLEYVIAFDKANYTALANSGNHLPSRQFYFLEGITWSRISTTEFAVRYSPAGMVFNSACPTAFASHDILFYALGLLNSSIVRSYVMALSPTMNFQAGDIDKVPFIISSDDKNRANPIIEQCIVLCQSDWDSFETSWDFQRHPLITAAVGQHYMRLEDCWRDWERACEERFAQLKVNEEELNRIFIGIYGLQDELTPDVDDKDVTVRRADLGRDIRSLISYAVGCMLGRYSLDKPGLAFAGGTWDADQYATYPADRDGILPITDDEYFEDDIVGMFINWVRTVYGEESLEENLAFIANALGGKGTPREVIRNYFLNDFYKDHLKVYQKRPIYWLFDSGKKNGFKCLIYMHRYQPDTIARIRTDYVHEMQSRYRTAMADVEQRMNGAATSDRVKLTKRLTALQEQAEELRLYEEKIHHLADQMISIDLDDGVKVNYAKFADVLASIK